MGSQPCCCLDACRAIEQSTYLRSAGPLSGTSRSALSNVQSTSASTTCKAEADLNARADLGSSRLRAATLWVAQDLTMLRQVCQEFGACTPLAGGLAGGVQAKAEGEVRDAALRVDESGMFLRACIFQKAGSAQLSPEQHAASSARKGPILSGAYPLGSTQAICGTCSVNGLLASGCDADWQGWCNFAVRRNTDRLQCVLPLG